MTFTAAASGKPDTDGAMAGQPNDGTTFSNIAGATSTTYSFNTTAQQNSYLYQAVFTNTQGSATTAAATLTVLASAPLVTTSPTSRALPAAPRDVHRRRQRQSDADRAVAVEHQRRRYVQQHHWHNVDNLQLCRVLDGKWV